MRELVERDMAARLPVEVEASTRGRRAKVDVLAGIGRRCVVDVLAAMVAALLGAAVEIAAPLGLASRPPPTRRAA